MTPLHSADFPRAKARGTDGRSSPPGFTSWRAWLTASPHRAAVSRRLGTECDWSDGAASQSCDHVKPEGLERLSVPRASARGDLWDRPFLDEIVARL